MTVNCQVTKNFLLAATIYFNSSSDKFSVRKMEKYTVLHGGVLVMLSLNKIN